MGGERVHNWIYTDEELALAKEVIDFLRPKGLPIYQVKVILDAAKEQLEQEPLASHVSVRIENTAPAGEMQERRGLSAPEVAESIIRQLDDQSARL